jgi:hypothetical protein
VASAAPHQSPALLSGLCRPAHTCRMKNRRQPVEKVPLPGQASIAGAVSLQASFPRHILQSPGEVQGRTVPSAMPGSTAAPRSKEPQPKECAGSTKSL